jgi:hypothetical protein
MKTLFDTAFNRFIKQGQTGVVKLTQAMGGGKTHNMLALGICQWKLDTFKNNLDSNHRVFSFFG